MPTTQKLRTPSYRLHKPTGKAVVTLNGRDVYLGKHGTRVSRDAYDRVIAEWLASGLAVATSGMHPRIKFERSFKSISDAFDKGMARSPRQ